MESVVLSHNHADHTTGFMPLRRLLGSNGKALNTLYVGSGIFLSRVTTEGLVDERMATIRRDYEATGGRVVEVEAPMRLQPGANWSGRTAPASKPCIAFASSPASRGRRAWWVR